jgi:hypothetical protein
MLFQDLGDSGEEAREDYDHVAINNSSFDLALTPTVTISR